jgi:hypothetical protein
MTRIPTHPAAILCGILALLAGLAAFDADADASGWTLRQLPATSYTEPKPGERIPEYPELGGVSCPSKSLCVAVGAEHTLAYSQTPAAGGWHVVNPTAGPSKNCAEEEPPCYEIGGRLQTVSCASPSLCVAITSEGIIYTSTDPTGPSSAWTPANINEPGGHGATHLTAISCPSAGLCVTVSGENSPGKILTSTDPASGQWETAELAGAPDLRGVSCGTPSFCVAVARRGKIFTSTEPTGGASAWSAVGAPGGPGDLEGVSCATTVLCAAGNLSGNVLTSTSPAATGATWQSTNAGRSVQITGLSCPTAGACVGVDNNGDVLASSDPTGGSAVWSFENLVPFVPSSEKTLQPPLNALFGLSCASTSFCALVGDSGRIFTSTDPFGAPADPPLRKARRRPRTILVWAEHFWRGAATRRRRVRAKFRFYSPTQTRGFECKRDEGRYRPCRSPLRYWVGHGRGGNHALRVRAIGPTGLRGPAALKRFRVLGPTAPADR